MKLTGVVAYSQNRVMGIDNQLPWHLPDDLKHFKSITSGKTVLMGRKTYDSIGRPLPNRRNIILSRDTSLKIPGCEVIHSLDQLINLNEEIFLIGGAELFKMLLPKIQTLYLTEVQTNISGDVFFPKLNEEEWHEISREHHPQDDKHAYSFDFVHLDKITYA